MSRLVQGSFFIIAISTLLIGPSWLHQSVSAQLPVADNTTSVKWQEGVESVAALFRAPDDLQAPQGELAKLDPKLVQSIRESSNFLNNRWATDRDHQPIPKAYLESLDSDTSQISRVVNAGRRGGVSTWELNDRLKDVADDLAIKASHCKLSPKGWASLISVEIKTLKRDQSAAKGLAVWYVPKGWADTEDRWIRCSKLSTPTSAGTLPPGLYMMRVETGSPVSIRIGGDGKDTQSVELLVP